MTGRQIAYNVLNRWKPRSPHGSRLLDEAFSRAEIAPAERGLATELVHGVMRRRETLNSLLHPHVSRPLTQVEPGALTLLWLGAYQLAMLSGIPSYAVVNETTELARQAGKSQWTGFVNAVLRSLSRSVTDELAAAPAANALPLAPGRFRRLKEDVFPGPDKNWPEYFISAFSFPRWLAGRWQTRYDRNELARLGFWFNAAAPLCLRCNRLRTTRDELLERLGEAGVKARTGTQPDAILLEETTFVQNLPGFHEGLFAVQDESAIAAAALLDPQPGERVLDLCAAPGGKTTHLAALMRNDGRLLAADVDRQRLRRVDESCRRMGVSIVETRVVLRERLDFAGETFDRILLDAPCSNTGVLGKRPDARWRLTPNDIPELAEIQARLLQEASAHLAPGGLLVYSTCSIEPDENQAVVDRFLAEQSEFERLHERHHIPGRPADGGYQVLLQRRA
jgi:16S rRNA (cytosine967-C5)-methyltransferase